MPIHSHVGNLAYYNPNKSYRALQDRLPPAPSCSGVSGVYSFVICCLPITAYCACRPAALGHGVLLWLPVLGI